MALCEWTWLNANELTLHAVAIGRVGENDIAQKPGGGGGDILPWKYEASFLMISFYITSLSDIILSSFLLEILVLKVAVVRIGHFSTNNQF